MATSIISAYIQCLDFPMPPIVFQFNPESYTVVTKGNWKSTPQPQGGSKQQWLGAAPAEVTVKILLDMFSVPPIPPSLVIEQLKMLVVPTAISQGVGAATAPTCMFGWGPNIVMDMAVVKSVSVAYERFLLGMPVRATATVTLAAVPPPAPIPPTNPTSGGLSALKTRTVVEGDTLASIAYQEYRDPNKWRAIAEANRIDDPMRIKHGTVLFVPDNHEADSMS
jgi:hypothetical protein